MTIPIDQLIRSSRKTLGLVVTAEGKLVVRAPQRLSRARIEEYIALKADWIARHQAQARQAKPAAPADRFTDGQRFWFLGQSYPLQVVDRLRPALTFDRGFILAQPALPQAERAFEAWYRKQAAQILAERTAVLAKKFGFSYRAVRITSARTRWGSCSSKNVLSFPWRLVMAPLPVIDYVVVHELVHTIEHNHQKKFWEKVAALAPAFKEHKQWLKSNSPSLRIL
jgi:predicted metal-dependent hydrolase